MAKNSDSEPTVFPVQYTIDNIEPWTMLDKLGNPAAGYRVTFSFAPGITTYVEVARSQYNKDSVQAAIEAEIMRHMGVLSL